MFRRVRGKPDVSPSDGPADRPRGHAHALSHLFEEHNRTLQSFLVARLGNEQEAREVVQEAYVRLLQLHQPGTVSYLRANRERLDRSGPEREFVDRLSPDRRLMAAEELVVLEQALRELGVQERTRRPPGCARLR